MGVLTLAEETCLNSCMKIVPQTRSGEVTDQLNNILGRGVYADAQAFEMRLLKRECERIRNVDAGVGWGLFGSYYTLLGDIDEAERSFKASLKLNKNPVACGNYYATLGNLGYFTRAHQYFLEVGKPELGMLSVLNAYAEGMGSFQAAVAYNKDAEAMGMVPQRGLNGASVKAAAILAKAGVTDEQVARHMDAAGEVLRRRKLFYHEDILVNVADIDGVFVGVTCVLGVNRAPKEVFELNVELARAEREMGVEKHPVFDVMFKPV